MFFLQGLPYTSYVLDYYASSAADSPGQGRRYLGSFTVTTDQYSFVPGYLIVASVGPTVRGDVITATATDYWGNTSTFSNGIPAN